MAAASYQKLEGLWNPILEQVYTKGVIVRPSVTVSPASNKPPPPPPSLPTQLGPFNWNPITFNWVSVYGQMQVTLFSNGGYNFNGSFTDPSAWDYDDQLAFGIVSSTGVLYMFSHSGSMKGWIDRWLGGSETDPWNNTGVNAAIQGGWADLCAGWRWHANAAVNSDIFGLVQDVENIIKAVETVVSIIAVIVA